MKVMCRNGVIGKMFEPLMKGTRVAPRPDIALKVTTCKRNEVKNKTVLLHSVYPLKDAARNKAAHEITSEHWNNRITMWTNIFDGRKDCMGDELNWWKWKEDRFQHLLFKKFHTDHKETLTITSGNALKMMKEYASKKNIPFSLNQRAAIIAEMVTDTTDTVNYGETLIKGKAKTAINSIKEEENYKPKLLKMLQDHYDECDRLLDCSEQTTTRAKMKLQIRQLTADLKKAQRSTVQYEKWCKRHLHTIDVLKKKSGAEPLKPNECVACGCMTEIDAPESQRGPRRVLTCGHVYHEACLDAWAELHQRTRCVICNGALFTDIVQQVYPAHSEDINDDSSSRKRPADVQPVVKRQKTEA